MNLTFKVFKAFGDSFHESVKAMTNLEIKRINTDCHIPPEAPFFTMISGYKGSTSGSCIIKSSAGAVIRLYEKYLGEKSEFLDSSVLDGVKELAGIINGAASAKEQALKLQFTPPLAVFSTLMDCHVSSKVVAAAVSYFVDECGVFTIEVHQPKPL